jgi:hypothetical protein
MRGSRGIPKSPPITREAIEMEETTPAKAILHDETSAEYWQSRYNELSDNLKGWGVIEIMVRNAAVSEYVSYLERALEIREKSTENTA